MASHDHEPMLPKVEESDLLALVVEEVVDPEHRGWWKEFASHNAVLAQQAIKRAYFDTQNIENLTSLELQRIIIDSVSFAIRALTIATQRQAEQAQETTDAAQAVPNPQTNEAA